MNSMNLKFSDVTERRSLAISDCHYVKKTKLILIITYFLCFLFFGELLNTVCHLQILCHNLSLFMGSILHFILW